MKNGAVYFQHHENRIILFNSSGQPLIQFSIGAAEMLARQLIDEVRKGRGQDPIAQEMWAKLLSERIEIVT